MNIIKEINNLQQKNKDTVLKLKNIIRDLITKASGAGLFQASKSADTKLNAQLASLKKLEIQLSKPPANLYQALLVARAQNKEISTIIRKVSSIKTSLNNTHAATSQTIKVSQQRHASPEKPREASPQNMHVFPAVPTTPVKPRINRTHLLLDKYIAVEKKLSQTQFQLASLKQIMLSENNTEKKVALYSQVFSAKKVQDSIQNNLNIIRSQLSDPKKNANLDLKLTAQLEILDRLDARMQLALRNSMPIVPVSKIRIAQNNLQNRSNDEDDSPRRGPHRR